MKTVSVHRQTQRIRAVKNTKKKIKELLTALFSRNSTCSISCTPEDDVFLNETREVVKSNTC